MEKYKRFVKKIKNDMEIQDFFDELTTEGWRILYYEERIMDVNSMIITTVCKKTNK